ncbi:MAG: hypothetical protein AMXMBFR7_05690 [Planctomycetota bacterium]
MGFLNALFLAGTATFALPVVIHLIFKLRKRTLVFSSLRFLRESVLRETRRLRLRDLLLLLLRCAACILIALAFARPYRAGAVLAGPSGELREDLVLVLDDSPSMAAQDGSTTRWQMAVDQALVAASAKNLERLGLVLTGDPGRPEVELARNFEATKEALAKRTRPGFVRGDPAQALQTALDLLADSAAPRRRVLLISDLQLNQMDRTALAETGQRAVTMPRPVQIEIRPPHADGKVPGKLNNLSLDEVRAKSDVWLEGRPVRFAVRLSNHGDGEASALAVRLLSGDKILAQRTVGLGPRDARDIELTALFPKAGPVHGRVEIDGRDVLPDDDRRFFALHLRDSIRAVIAEDRLRESGAWLDESYYVRMALDPRPRGGEAPKEVPPGAVRVDTVAARDLTPAVLKGADVLFLVGVTELPAATLATLEQAVQAGLNLVLFLGRSDGTLATGFYNGPFWKEGKGLLPARPGERFEGNLVEARFSSLDTFAVDHPLFAPFKGEIEQELRRPKFLRHFKPDPKDLSAGERPPGQVLATFSDGSPMTVERPFGLGRVLMFSFLPRPEKDTDLPKRTVFVPLMHQIVKHLSGIEQGAQRQLTVGEDLTLAGLALQPQTTVRLARPAPHNDTLDLTGSDHLTTDTVGLYTATYQPGQLAEQAQWAVNLDPAESELKAEDLAAIQALYASNLKEEDPDEGPKLALQADEELKAQAPDWRYLLVAALACLLLEVALRDFWGD